MGEGGLVGGEVFEEDLVAGSAYFVSLESAFLFEVLTVVGGAGLLRLLFLITPQILIILILRKLTLPILQRLLKNLPHKDQTTPINLYVLFKLGFRSRRLTIRLFRRQGLNLTRNVFFRRVP